MSDPIEDLKRELETRNESITERAHRRQKESDPSKDLTQFSEFLLDVVESAARRVDAYVAEHSKGGGVKLPEGVDDLLVEAAAIMLRLADPRRAQERAEEHYIEVMQKLTDD